jgi:hypothetical protein
MVMLKKQPQVQNEIIDLKKWKKQLKYNVNITTKQTVDFKQKLYWMIKNITNLI